MALKTIKGPAIFLAQFAGDEAPFNLLDEIGKWVARLGYSGVQLPSWDGRLFDLKKAAESQTYADEVKGKLLCTVCRSRNCRPTCKASRVAVHPAYDEAFDGFAPESVRRNRATGQQRAVQQLHSRWRRRLSAARPERTRVFRARLAWPYLYPWPHCWRAWLKPPSTSWPGAGSRFSTCSTRRVLTSAMKFIRAKTCTTV